MKETFNKERGQVLVLMVLVILVCLSIGIGISYKTLVSTKKASEEEQSLQAYAAADAGIEIALRDLKLHPWRSVDPTETTRSTFEERALFEGTPYESHYTYTIVPLGQKVQSIYETRIKKDDVAQVDLTGVSAGYKVNIYFWSSNISEKPDAALNCASYNAGALEYTYLAHRGTDYVVAKKSAFEPCSRTNGFTAVSQSTYLATELSDHSYNFLAEDLATDNYSFIVGTDSEALLRIKAWYTDMNVAVQLLDGSGNPAEMPVQGFKITADGRQLNNKHTVQLTKLNTYLPAVFDYALFSGDSLEK